MKKSKPYGFVYITTNLINGKKYIGQRKYRTNRKDDSNTYLGSGTIILQAIKKYGKENFSKEIVGEAYSKKELDLLEINTIERHNAINNRNYYNVAPGGEGNGGCLAGGNSPQAKKVICVTTNKIFDSITLASKYYGCPASRISANCKNKGHSSGELNGRRLAWMYYEDYKKASEDEVNVKISNADNNYKPSKETRKLWSKQRSGAGNSTARKVICLNTNEVFETGKAASLHYGLSRSNVNHCCRKEQKTAGRHPITGEKLEWMFYDEYIRNSQ